MKEGAVRKALPEEVRHREVADGERPPCFLELSHQEWNEGWTYRSPGPEGFSPPELARVTGMLTLVAL